MFTVRYYAISFLISTRTSNWSYLLSFTAVKDMGISSTIVLSKHQRNRVLLAAYILCLRKIAMRPNNLHEKLQ